MTQYFKLRMKQNRDRRIIHFEWTVWFDH